MNKIQRVFFLLLLTGLFVQSCDDIIEPNLDAETVRLISPASDVISDVTIQTFWWETLEGADEYRLQVVSPTFDSIVRLVVDSISTDDQIISFLPDGNYQWRVIGMNDAYESLHEVFNLEIRTDTSSNLSGQVVSLLSPASGNCTSNEAAFFVWTELAQADKYVFQLGDAAFNNLLIDEEVLGNTYSFSLPDEETYYWRVRAENNNSLTFTTWATGSVTLDQTNPDPAELLFPDEGFAIIIEYQNPDLGWASSSDSVSDTLLVYADETADTLLLKVAVDATDYNLDESSYDFNQIGEDFFWEIISVDKAGNVSEPGELRLFYVD